MTRLLRVVETLFSWTFTAYGQTSFVLKELSKLGRKPARSMPDSVPIESPVQKSEVSERLRLAHRGLFVTPHVQPPSIARRARSAPAS